MPPEGPTSQQARDRVAREQEHAPAKLCAGMESLMEEISLYLEAWDVLNG